MKEMITLNRTLHVCRVLIGFITLFFTPVISAEMIRVQTEGALTLSVAQEAEHAVERAQQWLKDQPIPSNDPTRECLTRYALMPSYKTLTLTPKAFDLLNQAVPQAVTTNDETQNVYKQLFARQLLRTSPHPSADWREQMAQRIINAQRITPQGAYWQDAESTLWAILTLRALLNDAPILKIEETKTAPAH